MGSTISGSAISKDFRAMERIYETTISFDRVEMGYYYQEKDFSIKRVHLKDEEIDALNYSSLFLNKFLCHCRCSEKNSSCIEPHTAVVACCADGSAAEQTPTTREELGNENK
jgi:hypothetical protein